MTAQDLWTKLTTLYQWLGAHRSVAAFILGALTAVVVMKAL